MTRSVSGLRSGRPSSRADLAALDQVADAALALEGFARDHRVVDQFVGNDLAQELVLGQLLVM